MWRAPTKSIALKIGGRSFTSPLASPSQSWRTLRPASTIDHDDGSQSIPLCSSPLPFRPRGPFSFYGRREALDFPRVRWESRRAAGVDEIQLRTLAAARDDRGHFD